MPFEKRRSELNLTPHKWGDHPPKLPHHAGNRIAKAREMPRCSLAHFDLECAPPLDVAGTNNMKGPVEYIPLASKLPISTVGWSLPTFVKSFLPVPRVSCHKIDLQAEIAGYEQSGVPLIIEGWHNHKDWPEHLFNIDSFSQEVKAISARNVHDRSDSTLDIADFVARCRASSTNTYPGERERLYGKDADCPDRWVEWLHKAGVIPSSLLPDAPTNLLRNLPNSSSVETLMCYLGIGDTFTPCHKDLCASSGQNLMCYTENEGSSFWFMTKGSDAPKVSEYFHSLQQELDHETHVVTVEQLAQAPFSVYIAEQKLGDLVLVPPRSCHQVVNHGGITIKTSWSRMTLKGLITAYYHELPIYRRVCRPETYQVKATIYYTLLRCTDRMKNLYTQGLSDKANLLPADQHGLAMDMKELLRLFDDILVEEYSPDYSTISCMSSAQPHAASPAPSNASSVTLTHGRGDVGDAPAPQDPGDRISCDFCGGDIFQSFFECSRCVEPKTLGDSEMDERGDSYMVCAGCYVEGRSCNCKNMDAMQCQPFDSLLQLRREAFHALCAIRPNDSSLSTLKQEPNLMSTTGVFRAARVLEQTRRHKRETKACTLARRGETSHTVPFSWALTCKKCHSAKCFAHLLDLRIHSADALLQQVRDESHESFHNHHLKSRSTYHNAMQAFSRSQEEGVRPDITHHRVHVALAYRICKPADPNLSCCGWYDINQISSPSFKSENRNRDFCDSDMSISPPASPNPPPTSVLNMRPPSPAMFTHPTSLTSEGQAKSDATSLKRTHRVYVLVPRAKYITTPKSFEPQLPVIGSKPTHTDVQRLAKPFTSAVDPSLPQEKRKEMRPIPRRKPYVGVSPRVAPCAIAVLSSAGTKRPHSGSGSHSQGNGSLKRKAPKADIEAATAKRGPSLSEIKRDRISVESRKRIPKNLKISKYSTKTGTQRASNNSFSSPSSSSSSRPSSSVSLPVADAGLDLAQALNRAVTHNHHSSANADEVMHNIDEPGMATNHMMLSEGSTDLASLKSDVNMIKEQLTQLQARQAPSPSQVLAPSGMDAFNFTWNQNQAQPMLLVALPQTTQFWQGQHSAEGGWWHQENHNRNQYLNQGPSYNYNGGPTPYGPALPSYSGHHHRPQARLGPYQQRHEDPRYPPQNTPRRRFQHPQAQNYHWGRRQVPRHEDNQGRFDVPARSTSYRQGGGQEDVQSFTRESQFVRDGFHHAQDPRNFIAQDVQKASERPQEEHLVSRRPEVKALGRLQSIPNDSPDAQSPSMRIFGGTSEQTQENTSGRRSPPSSAHWEDEYEQEDPVAPEGKIFKASEKAKDAFIDPTANPWQ